MEEAGRRRLARVLWCASAWLIVLATHADADGAKAQEEGVKRLLATYEHAIESKDLTLFRSVKPNLTAEEERRLRKAFDSTRTHEVTITVEGVECQDRSCVVHLIRRDTLDASIVSSFPQTLRLTQTSEGFVIDEIGR
jgi:uncharacterized membrane protein